VLRTDPEIARRSAPVDIVELKRGDFAHSHAKTDQHWQNGDVAAAIPSCAIV
jgi:hypothetical protein